MEYKNINKCYSNDFMELYHCDCMELLKQTPDNYYSLALVDPPYGIGISGQKEVKKGKKSDRKLHVQKNWDNAIPSKEYFNELFRISKNQIIWGANYFVEHLTSGHKGWIVWDKMQHGLTMSDCELAYSSFDYPTRVWCKNRCVLKEQKTIHPTEKPTDLYDWILKNYAEPNQKILDSHFGSGSIALAVHKANQLDKMNLHLTACEIDKEYIDKAIKRISESTKQGTLSF